MFGNISAKMTIPRLVNLLNKHAFNMCFLFGNRWMAVWWNALPRDFRIEWFTLSVKHATLTQTISWSSSNYIHRYAISKVNRHFRIPSILSTSQHWCVQLHPILRKSQQLSSSICSGTKKKAEGHTPNTTQTGQIGSLVKPLQTSSEHRHFKILRIKVPGSGPSLLFVEAYERNSGTLTLPS